MDFASLGMLSVNNKEHLALYCMVPENINTLPLKDH